MLWVLIPRFQKNFTIDEFNLITDNGEKWDKNIKLFMYGIYTKEDSLTVVKTINEFNELLETISIELVSVIDSSNSVIYFTTDNEFIKLFPSSEKGVRNLKRCLEIIHTKINLFRLMKPGSTLFDNKTS